MSEGAPFERTGGEEAWSGETFSVRVDRFRHADGEEVEREIVERVDAVGIVAHDDEHVWLVRQPREAVGDPALLEIPAGKIDAEGESPRETAERELAEEIGKAAAEWEEVTDFWVTPGFATERMHLFVATGLSDADAEAEENERIEIVRWPLARLGEAIDACRDSKSLIGLLMLERRLR